MGRYSFSLEEEAGGFGELGAVDIVLGVGREEGCCKESRRRPKAIPPHDNFQKTKLLPRD